MENIKIEITRKEEITVRNYDKKRCAFECKHIAKYQGTYHCTMFDKEVDQGDDDKNNDYLFLRCEECLTATGDK